MPPRRMKLTLAAALLFTLAACTDGTAADSSAGGADANGLDAAPLRDGSARDDLGGTDPNDATVDRGVSSGPPPRSACESFEVQLKPDDSLVPKIMLVVDYSGSMDASGEWDRMVSALRAVTASVDDVVHFGLVLFPDPRGGPDVCSLGRLVVEPDARAAERINTQLAIYQSPHGGTPTATTLQGVRRYLAANHPEGPSIVILATDGGPGCSEDLTWPCECIPDTNCQLAPQNCFDVDNTVQAVRDLASDGVQTYVIGVPGSEAVSDLLDRLARVGGTAVDRRHYAVDDEDGLIDALQDISGGVVPCRYQLENPPDDPDRVVLLIDGIDMARDRDRRDGWDLTDETHVDLYGSVCRRVRDGELHQIEVRYNCTE
jgi:hypothetical protein